MTVADEICKIVGEQLEARDEKITRITKDNDSLIKELCEVRNKLYHEEAGRRHNQAAAEMREAQLESERDAARAEVNRLKVELSNNENKRRLTAVEERLDDLFERVGKLEAPVILADESDPIDLSRREIEVQAGQFWRHRDDKEFERILKIGKYCGSHIAFSDSRAMQVKYVNGIFYPMYPNEWVFKAT